MLSGGARCYEIKIFDGPGNKHTNSDLNKQETRKTKQVTGKEQCEPALS